MQNKLTKLEALDKATQDTNSSPIQNMIYKIEAANDIVQAFQRGMQVD